MVADIQNVQAIQTILVSSIKERTYDPIARVDLCIVTDRIAGSATLLSYWPYEHYGGEGGIRTLGVSLYFNSLQMSRVQIMSND